MSFWTNLIPEWDLKLLELRMQGYSDAVIQERYQAHLRSWLHQYEQAEQERKRQARTLRAKERAKRFLDLHEDRRRADQVRRELASNVLPSNSQDAPGESNAQRDSLDTGSAVIQDANDLASTADLLASVERLDNAIAKAQAELIGLRLQRAALIDALRQAHPAPTSEPTTVQKLPGARPTRTFPPSSNGEAQTAARPSRCATCNRSFKDDAALLAHNKVKHRPPGEASRPTWYPQAQASKVVPARKPPSTPTPAFASYQDKRETGLAPLPFLCSRCQCAFKTRASLNAHVDRQHPDWAAASPRPVRLASTTPVSVPDRPQRQIRVLRNGRYIKVNLYGDPDVQRLNHCWSCKESLDSDSHMTCDRCHGMICTTGHCFCSAPPAIWNHRRR